MSIRRAILVVTSGACLLTGLAVKAEEGMPGVPVRVVQALSKELAPVTWLTGTVIGRNDARVAAEVAGRLDTVLDVGDQVVKGGVIARLDGLTFRLDLAEADATVARAKARLGYLRRESERLEKLAASNHAARNQLDQTQSDRDASSGDLKAALASQARVQDRLDKTVVRAPFNGVVTERVKRPGEHVEDGEVIVRLVDPEVLEIQTQAPRRSAAHIRRGEELRVSDGERETVAKVRTLVPIGDERSHLYELRLDFTEPSWGAGHILRVAVPSAASRVATVVPRDALVIRRDGTAVFRVIEDNTAERIPVTVGNAQGSAIEIRGAVHPGDRIVVHGNERLRPGQRVTVR